MPSQHKYPAISFRPPEDDRNWLIRFAERIGKPVNRVLAEALSEYRRNHDPSPDTRKDAGR